MPFHLSSIHPLPIYSLPSYNLLIHPSNYQSFYLTLSTCLSVSITILHSCSFIFLEKCNWSENTIRIEVIRGFLSETKTQQVIV